MKGQNPNTNQSQENNNNPKAPEKLSIQQRALGVVTSPLIFVAEFSIGSIIPVIATFGLAFYIASKVKDRDPKTGKDIYVTSKNPLRYLLALVVSVLVTPVVLLLPFAIATANLYYNIKNSLTGEAKPNFLLLKITNSIKNLGNDIKNAFSNSVGEDGKPTKSKTFGGIFDEFVKNAKHDINKTNLPFPMKEEDIIKSQKIEELPDDEVNKTQNARNNLDSQDVSLGNTPKL